MNEFIPWRSARRRRTVWFSFITLCVFGLVALLAPWLAPHDPYEWRLERSNLSPLWIGQQSVKPALAGFPLGTDRYGRDILSRLLYGTRTAFALAVTAVPLAALIGAIVGLCAGYVGGRVDAGIKMLIDTIQSLPGIMFMVIILLVCRGLLTTSWIHGLLSLIIGFAAISWASLARLVRISAMQLKSRLFVEAAISIGVAPRRLVARHLLPNLSHVILVWIINNIPAVILMEAVLGYVGVGVTGAVDGGEFTVVSFGGMFFAGRSAMSRNPLMLIIPSLCILLISMSFILLGDFLDVITRAEQSPPA